MLEKDLSKPQGTENVFHPSFVACNMFMFFRKQHIQLFYYGDSSLCMKSFFCLKVNA